jgi:hypothetical protein
VCIAVLHNLVAGLLARSQYPEGPATGHLGTGFSWFPCVQKRMLRWFPRLPVATTCFSCSPPDLNFLDPSFIFMYMYYDHCHRATAHLRLNILLLLLFPSQSLAMLWERYTCTDIGCRSVSNRPLVSMTQVKAVINLFVVRHLSSARMFIKYTCHGNAA